MLDFLPPIWNGTLREHYLLLFGTAGAVALVTGLVGAWLGARLGSSRMSRRVSQLLTERERGPGHDPQLAELMRAVDAISIEVERLAEGQRYTAKLLAERTLPARQPAPRAPDAITPH